MPNNIVNPEEALVSILKGDSPVIALVGTNVYPSGDVPQGTARPYITYFRLSGNRHTSLNDGVGNLNQPKFQVDYWGTSYANSKAVAVAAQYALTTASGSHASMQVDGIRMTDDRDVPDKPIDGTDQYTKRVSQTFQIFVNES